MSVLPFHQSPLELPHPVYIPIGCHGIASALLAARVRRGPAFNDPQYEFGGIGYREIDVQIEFAALEAPLAGVTVRHSWFVHTTNRFPWPSEGGWLPILVHLEKARLEGKPAAKLLRIERAQWLATLS